MTPVVAGDFPAFFEAVWGFAPFDWQVQLVEEVEHDGWPDLVDLPTGTGKTAAIDVALFTLAIDAARAPSERVRPRRIVTVVDRRVVVDQAHQRARHIQTALTLAPPGSLTGRVAAALEALSDGGPPLVTSVLRGGIVRDETWARRPDIPAVIASTVDQVGSRLLFRGYGLPTGARPIHAALLGFDTLFLLDEVHLALPFAETLRSISRLRRRQGHNGHLPDRSAVVRLSATPGEGGTDSARRFPLQPIQAGTNPVLRRRLDTSKPAELEEVKASGKTPEANQKFAKAAATRVEHHLAGGVTRIAVMVNRVDTARRVARILDPHGDRSDIDVVLLTGRMRPVDRARIVDGAGGSGGLTEVLAPGAAPPERPVVVVATQSLEVGADFDFDVLVTECASLDALRQRFGRVARDGRAPGTEPPRSTILARAGDVKADATDPVYGEALSRTWSWLKRLERIDFGHQHLPGPDPEGLAAMLSPREHAPLLAASHLDRWCQTSQRAVAAEPEVAQWLHGVSATDDAADIQVVWRASLTPTLFGDLDAEPGPGEGLDPGLSASDERDALVTDQMTAVPPLAQEALGVPVSEVRRWLAHSDDPGELTDLTGAPTPPAPARDPGRPRRAARWADGAAKVVTPDQLRPGDTIVVPAGYGGIYRGTWDPATTGPVEDHSATLSVAVRQTMTLLLDHQTCSRFDLAWPDPDQLEQLPSDERAAALGEALTSGGVDLLRHAGVTSTELRGPWRAVVVTTGFDHAGADRHYLITAPVRAAADTPGDDLAVDGSGDALSLIGSPVRLDDHLAGVGDIAAAFAARLGWPDETAATLRLAGELHDVGKIDSRFQAILHGGAEGRVPLAKSELTANDAAGRRRARQASGYPRGARHELLSVAMLDHPDPHTAGEATDDDLVRHLLATHHGRGRYRFLPTIDSHPEDVDYVARTSRGTIELHANTDHGLDALGAEPPQRFWRLNAHYGWWTLAYLEAVLRLADHWRSHLEQRGIAHDHPTAPEER